MKLIATIGIILVISGLFSCEVSNDIPDPKENPEFFNWIIPKSEIINRGTPDDAIPAIDNPVMVSVNKVNFLADADLIMGVNNGTEFHAYPLKIMQYHEVVNDEFLLDKIQASYCPLSGTCNAWVRNNMLGVTTTFGVSEFIYNSHHILYDRATRSNWYPIINKCVNGEFESYSPKINMVVETTWGNWKNMFPSSKVLALPTDQPFNYDVNAYAEYATNDELVFQVSPLDPLLPPKEKVLSIIVGERSKVYRYSSIGDTTTIISDNHQGLSVVVVGNKLKRFMVAFERRFKNGAELEFLPNNDAPNIIMSDQLGNKYDIFGLIVDGPNKGQSLNRIQSITGYWFVIAATYPDPLVY